MDPFSLQAINVCKEVVMFKNIKPLNTSILRFNLSTFNYSTFRVEIIIQYNIKIYSFLLFNL